MVLFLVFGLIPRLTRLLPSPENHLAVQSRRDAGKDHRANLARSVDVRFPLPLATRPPSVYVVLLHPSILQPWRPSGNRWCSHTVSLHRGKAFCSRLTQPP